jgi:hypothetical protein
VSPHDFLGDPEPANTPPPTRRQQRRAAKNAQHAARREAKADARDRYKAKLRDARDAPRSPLALLIVGVLFFGGIIVVGTIAGTSGHTEPAKQTTSTAAPAPVTQPTSNDFGSTPSATPDADSKTTASTWLIAYFPGQDWQQYVAPSATDAVQGIRAGFFDGTYLSGDSVNVQEYTWRDVTATGTSWTGTVDVLLDPGRTPPLVASLQVTMTTTPTPKVSGVKVLYYGEGQD